MWVYKKRICGVFKLYMGVYMVYIRCILGAYKVDAVSYTHLTLPTNREV